MSDIVIAISKRPATVKNTYIIDLKENQTLLPLEKRKLPQFQEYFDLLWKEFEHYEQ